MFLPIFFYIFGILITLWILFRVKNRIIFENVKNCGEIDHYPLIGSAHLCVGREPEDTFRTLIDEVKNTKISPVKVWIFSKLLIVVTKPDDVQKILTSPHCINKGSCYEIIPASCGLVFADAKFWKPHRKFLNPVFHIAQLKSFISKFNDISNELCNDLNLLANKVEFDISPIIGYRSLDLSLQTAFGANFSTTTTRKFFADLKKVMEIVGAKMIRYYTSLILFKISRFFNIELQDRKLLDQSYTRLTPIIEKTKQEYLKEIEKNGGIIETEEELSHKPETLIKKLTKLTELGYITQNFKQGHIESMLLAGSDTLTVSVSNILLMLAMETEAQEKCVLELKAVLGEQPSFIDFNQLSKLTYLDRTIKECLRLIPTVPLIVRKCETDLKLANCTIPNGTDVIISIVNMNLDSEHWGENSRKFNVDHFLPENVAKRHPVSYIPFSYGSRNCIGYKYANFAMKIMIAHLLLKFKFTTKLKYEDLKFAFGITLLLRNDYIISIENR